MSIQISEEMKLSDEDFFAKKNEELKEIEELNCLEWRFDDDGWWYLIIPGTHTRGSNGKYFTEDTTKYYAKARRELNTGWEGFGTCQQF